jgi:hypothetical protein
LRLLLSEEGVLYGKGVRELSPGVYRVFSQSLQGSVRLSVMMLPGLGHINSVGDPSSFSIIQLEHFCIRHVVSLVFCCFSAVFDFGEVFREEGDNVFIG